MAETHINAFYANVDEKKQAVEQAKAELDQAERLLKAHPDFVEPPKKVKEPQDGPQEHPKHKPEAKETKTKK